MNERKPADQMAVCMARYLTGFQVLQLGLASPLGQVAACLAKRLNPDLLLEDPAALSLSTQPRQATITHAEKIALQGAMQQFQAPEWIAGVMPTLAGRVGQFIRPLEVDLEGRVNTLRVRKKTGEWLRVAGLAGLAELAELVQPFLIYLPAQDRRCLVEKVQYAVCDPLRHAGERARVVIVSNLAVIEIRRSGARVISIHSGVSTEQLREASPPGLSIDSPPPTEAPSAAELAALNEVDAEGVRYLEFLSGAERLKALAGLALAV